ncbi:ATP-grasp domain-containing protein [Streptomyces alkaliterrae]|uniref:ATP-grasp domain-containing protein n=1 Tax=Streptomyces alkaliterrae TaxID=2213162 RepID=A0A5P0YQ74_9ACTN|nr:ATP-grasp domain-containing protein [Streptomyces alkaliterrae]MBB1259044.1 ATP-grasp domain-containing protein [Streptomyces alkaliterrae]MQS02466.1 ATP-grasp domain-containing protein [Streptomyces alkaliterrae]
MKILVVHQVPYRKIDYRDCIDHTRHQVTYVGHPHRMADLPEDLPAERITLGADEDLVEGVRARTSPGDGYDKVLSLSEFGIIEACHIRRHLGIDGPDLGQAERVRDKVAMKEALTGSGLRLPRFVADPTPCRPLPWSGRTVLKPRQGASSEDVTVHETAREALGAYQKLADPEGFQLEEHIDGDILHADGLIVDREIVDLAVSRYVNKPVEYANGVPLGSHQEECTEEQRRLAQRVVSVLGIEEGSLHLEFFETESGELVFLEVANRVGGAAVVPMHERHTGVHLPSHEIAVRLGLERPPAGRPSGRYHGWLAFPGHHLPPGRPRRTHLPEWVRAHPCTDRIHLLGPEQEPPRHITYQEWEVPVFVEASHADAGELRRFLQRCAREITVHSRPADAPPEQREAA